MATRTIVTSQPDVACDVCQRRLLRGEQPDVFLAAGRRLTVCELCAPRAAHEGWTRERDAQSVALPPIRPRRGRSLLDRFRQGASRGAEVDAEAEGPYDYVEPPPAPTAAATAAAAAAVPAGGESERELEEWAVLDGPPRASSDPPSSYLLAATDVFNASEFPRRLAGVARSLGEPEVNVRSAEHLESVVRIVVAWELCWYRYEVDLGEDVQEARLLTQGTELSELDRDERLANALADERGAIALIAA